MLDGLWNGWKVGKVFRNPVNWSVEVGRWNANFYRWCMRFLPSTAHSGQARDDVCFMPWGSQFYSVRKTTFKRAFFSKAVISRFILFKRNIEIIWPHSCSRFFFLGNAWVTKVQGLPPKKVTRTHTQIYIHTLCTRPHEASVKNGFQKTTAWDSNVALLTSWLKTQMDHAGFRVPKLRGHFWRSFKEEHFIKREHLNTSSNGANFSILLLKCRIHTFRTQYCCEPTKNRRSRNIHFTLQVWTLIGSTKGNPLVTQGSWEVGTSGENLGIHWGLPKHCTACPTQKPKKAKTRAKSCR